MHTATDRIIRRGAKSPAHRAPAAFTLIELLTVIAIIGILAAILIPTVGKVRATAKKAACASNLRQVGTALLAFAMDNKAGGLPGYYKIKDKDGEGHTVSSTSGAAGPVYWADNGVPTRSVPGQLVPYLSTGVKGSGSKSGKIAIMLCPSNSTAVSTYETSDPAPSYALGLKVRTTRNTLQRPFSNSWSTPSLRLNDIASPRTAVALFDTDKEFIALVGTAAIGTAAPTAAHDTTRNVLYFDGHIASVDKNVDPYETL